MNQEQSYNPYMQQEPKKNAAYFRARAREALKHCYWYAVLAFLLASLLGGVVTSGSSVSFNVEDNDLFETEIYFTNEEIELIENGDFSALLDKIPFSPYFWIAIIGFALVTSLLFSIFVSSPIKLGYQRYHLNVVDGNGRGVRVLFSYFARGYGKSIGVSILYSLLMFALSLPLLAVFLVMIFPSLISFAIVLIQADGMVQIPELVMQKAMQLLLSILICIAVAIVTAIVQTVIQCRYAFCFMILAEYPELGVLDAFRNSASLMKGKKWKYFCLQFSFIGWHILSAFTCGLGEIFLTPYIQTANAVFYDEIANRAAARETEFPSLDPDDYAAD